MSTTSSPRRPNSFGLALAAATLGITGAAVAADKTSQAAKPPAAPAARLVPLNSGIGGQEFPSDASKVTLERRADGTRIYHLNGQGMQSLIARIGKDGKIEYTCTDRPEQALHSTIAEKADER